MVPWKFDAPQQLVNTFDVAIHRGEAAPPAGAGDAAGDASPLADGSAGQVASGSQNSRRSGQLAAVWPPLRPVEAPSDGLLEVVKVQAGDALAGGDGAGRGSGRRSDVVFWPPTRPRGAEDGGSGHAGGNSSGGASGVGGGNSTGVGRGGGEGGSGGPLRQSADGSSEEAHESANGSHLRVPNTMGQACDDECGGAAALQRNTTPLRERAMPHANAQQSAGKESGDGNGPRQPPAGFVPPLATDWQAAESAARASGRLMQMYLPPDLLARLPPPAELAASASAADNTDALLCVGRWGEQCVYEFLRRQAGADAASTSNDDGALLRVVWVNEHSESGLPYDIEIVTGAGSTYVEVKSSAAADKDFCEISAAEMDCAREHEGDDAYHLYRVAGAGGPDGTILTRYVNPYRLWRQQVLRLVVCLPTGGEDGGR